jgi:hypothetical protein
MANKANNKAIARRDSFKKDDLDTLPDDFDGRLVYERMIEVFFFFKPVEELNETVHENFMGYGTAAHEFFKNHEQLMGMARMQADQLRNQEYTLTRKPVAAKLLAAGDSCLIIEEFELYLHENEHRLPLRLSVILERMNGNWLVSHFHGSTPDSNIAEKEAFPMEGLRRKNRELEEKIKERTHELEIEAALERVRTRTMAMHKSEELAEVASILFQQINELGAALERMNIGIAREEEGYFEFWSTEQGGKRIDHLFKGSFEEPTTLSKVFAAWKTGEKSIVIDLTGKALKDWIQHLQIVIGLPFNTDLIHERRVHSVAFFKHGALLVSTPEPLSTETINLLQRFANVFEQTYTRFLDLQKAEAQAREAQIEAALERVRAHTMGMQSSKDLSKVASVLFEEMKNLGGDLFAFGIVLCDKYKDRVEQWHNIGNQGMMSPFSVPIDLDYIHRYRYDQWEAGEELFSIEISEDYIARHFELMFELPSVKAAMDEVAAQGIQVKIPAWEIDYGASFRHGYLLVSSLKPFLEDYIFPRFARVFEQTYTRFLDLQKAEEQTREAKIEVALERVRARSMAMHKSDELAETAAVLFQQLNELAVKPERINIGIVREEERIIEWWSTEQGVNKSITFSRGA